MKCKKFFVLYVGVVLALAVLSACKEQEPQTLDDFSWEQISGYTTEVSSDGNVITATVVAPEYAKIIESIVKKDPNIDVTIEVLGKAINEHPDKVKEYSFVVSSESEETVREAFLDQVSYELTVIAITNIESSYTEQWEVE